MIRPDTLFAPSVLSQISSKIADDGPAAWPLPDSFNIADMCCDRWAKAQPRRLALIEVKDNEEARHWSYAELYQAANQLAHYLRAQNIAEGDRIAVLLPQGPEVLIAHFAAYRIGAILLPLFTLFGPDALHYRLSDSGAKLVITDTDSLEKLAPLSATLPNLSGILACGQPEDRPKTQEAVAIQPFWPELNQMPTNEIAAISGADDPAMLIYTSGTTGYPKGALQAQRFLMGHLPNIEISHQGFPQAGDKGWTPADWAWIGGLMDLALPALYYGVPLISHRMRKFDAEKAFQLIATYQIRNMFLPPTALKMMQAYNLTHSLPEGVNIRTIASGGEALPQTVTDWANTQLGVSINEIYGQTECNLVICTNRPAESCPYGFMGKAVPGHELAIFDGDGKMLPAGEIGQIGIASPDPVMFLGYWGQTEKTQAKFHGKWLMTGDLAVRNEDGFFRFVSRDDDIISSAGYRIGPTEIENCLISHKDIVNAGVIGLPDALKGEAITAIIVPQTGIVGTDRLAEELKTLIREKLSPHMCPKHIFWTEELPLTTTGKVMRRELRAYYADTHKGS